MSSPSVASMRPKKATADRRGRRHSSLYSAVRADVVEDGPEEDRNRRVVAQKQQELAERKARVAQSVLARRASMLARHEQRRVKEAMGHQQEARAQQLHRQQSEALRRASLDLVSRPKGETLPWALSDAHKQELRDTFVLLDTDMDGRLHPQELVQAVRTAGLHPSPAVLRSFARDASGCVGLRQFLAAAQQLLSEPVEHRAMCEWLSIFEGSAPLEPAHAGQARTLVVPNSMLAHVLAGTSSEESLTRAEAGLLQLHFGPLRVKDKTSIAEVVSKITEEFSPIAM